jgi:hypothetical protein
MTNVRLRNSLPMSPSEGVNERTRKGSAVDAMDTPEALAVLALENRSRCLDPRYTSRYTIALRMVFFQ